MTHPTIPGVSPVGHSLNPASGEPLAIYVHWPWCKRKCPYCDFNSHVDEAAPADDYLEALLQDMQEWRNRTGPRPVSSVFIGGGTPSLMGAARVSRLLIAIDRLYGLDAQTEVSMECNPTSSSAALFKDLAAGGVNRVSIGVQSLQDNLLQFLGREHSAADARATIDEALRYFNRVSVDMIYGLPQQDLDLWTKDLLAMARAGLTHISAYQLTVEPNTAFYSQVNKHLWCQLDSDLQADFAYRTKDVLEGEGYTNYEISNFSLAGEMCRHNLHVWQYRDYLGVGAGAHGRVKLANGQRYATATRKDPLTYIQRMQQGLPPLVLEHNVSEEDAWQEALLMGLRLASGIDLAYLRKVLEISAYETACDHDEIEQLVRSGMLKATSNSLAVTETGWWQLNAILGRILR